MSDIPSCIFVPHSSILGSSRRNSEPLFEIEDDNHCHCGGRQGQANTDKNEESFSSSSSLGRSSNQQASRIPRSRRLSQPTLLRPSSCEDMQLERIRRWATTGSASTSSCVCSSPPSLPRRSSDVIRKPAGNETPISLEDLAHNVKKQKRRSHTTAATAATGTISTSTNTSSMMSLPKLPTRERETSTMTHQHCCSSD